MAQINRQWFSNGLVLLAESVPGAESLAMTMLVPGGVAMEPAGQQGAAAMLSELICRGAGGLNAREHSDALDRLGVERSTSVEIDHLCLGATMIGAHLDTALPLLLDMVRQPNLDAEALEPTRDLALQSLDALADDPQHRVMLSLRGRHYPAPFGRSPLGCREDLAAMSLEDLQKFWHRVAVPSGSILAFAGDFDWTRLQGKVSNHLGDWTGSCEAPQSNGPPLRGVVHESAQTTQVHIAVAYDAVPERHENAMLQKAAASVLSGGMSGRLFTEVREKRGLCYAVFAMYAGHRDRGAMLGYAGTTAPRAQETLDVMTAELLRLSSGIEPDEFNRAIVGMKSRLVMQGESTGARAGAIAADQYIHGAPRSLDELSAEIDAVTLERLNAFVRKNKPGEMTVATTGPEKLTV